MTAKKLFIKTYGCQMNVYDSARMESLLARHGYRTTQDQADADLVVLNTCHIREKAAEKVYSELGRLRQLREERERQAPHGQARGLEIAVAGCVAQAEGDAMLERAPFVDVVVGPQAYHRLPELLAKRARGRGGVVDTDFPVESKFDLLPEEGDASAVSAFLSVQEGCDKFCTFCVVPYTRGAEESRPVASVLAEARRLVAKGAREVTLLGQNVNAYHGLGPGGRAWGLGRLIRELAELPGLARIRYTTSHPRDFDDGLIEAHRDVPALMPYLHLPVQSGSNRVLKGMNRKHDVEGYERLIDRLREARPDLALSSDFIVGFPGEREEDHRDTLRLVERVGFASAFSFKYSRRPGTPGAVMPGQVKEEDKVRRLAELQALLQEQANAFNAAKVGELVEVLVERPGRRAGQLAGKSPWLQAVHFDPGGAEIGIGDRVTVRVEAATANSLTGSLEGATPRERRAIGPDAAGATNTERAI